MKLIAQEKQLKTLIKAAVVEALEEREDLLREAVSEALENFALVRAIKQGERSATVSREKIFQLLRAK